MAENQFTVKIGEKVDLLTFVFNAEGVVTGSTLIDDGGTHSATHL